MPRSRFALPVSLNFVLCRSRVERESLRIKQLVKPVRTIAPDAAPVPRLYLYITAAITGAAVLVVEILGAKMLAPWLGTSHFVWTAQISVTLLALAAGYYVG